MQAHILSWVIFLPLLFLLGLLLVPSSKAQLCKYVALAGVGLQFVVMLTAFFSVNNGIISDSPEAHLQLVEKANWISFDIVHWGKFSADYFVGADGINLYLLLLASFVLLIGVISSWNIQTSQKGYFALYLILCTAVMGCFGALDMLLFFIFFEFMLLPMYFLIGIWGGPRREYAAIKFFIYTLVGSVCILLVMIGLYNSVIDPVKTAHEAGLITEVSQYSETVKTEVQTLLAEGKIASENVVHTFNMFYMMDVANFLPDSLFAIGSKVEVCGYPARYVGFLLLFVGFCIKLPMVPLHTWLPDAHVQAPTPISVVLAGILLKIGGYGLMRVVYPIFPDAGIYFSEFISILAMITIVYAAYVSLAMVELKKLVAYSSVSHMGFVVLGLASYTSEGVSGALYQMISHGIISPMLFLICGVIYDRTHKLRMTEYKGLVAKMPVFTAFVTVGFFASLGLPGFSGFISEIFVFLGAFASQGLNGLVPRWTVVISLLGLVITAGYYLWALQRVFFGKFWVAEKTWEEKLTDLTVREYILLIPLGALSLAFGIFPHLILDSIGGSVNAFVHLLTAHL